MRADKSMGHATILAILTALVCLGLAAVRTIWPAVVRPRLDLPAVAALSLGALVLERYTLKHAPRRQWGFTALWGGLAFGLLPLCAGLAHGPGALRLGLAGGAAFTVLTFLFDTVGERLHSGPSGRLAPLLAGGILFLACQGFAGMLL